MLLVWLMVQERSNPDVVVNDRRRFCQLQGIQADSRANWGAITEFDQSLNVGLNCLIDSQ